LDHESRDHSVEDSRLVVTLLHILQKILNALGGLVRTEFQKDTSQIGLYLDLRADGEGREAKQA
jgi:hypothetical protein